MRERRGGDGQGWSRGRSPRRKTCQGCRFLPLFPTRGQRLNCPLLSNNVPSTRRCPYSLLGGRTEWLPRRRQAGQGQHRRHPGEGGGNLAGRERPAVGEQVCLHSWQASGFQSTFCFCHISQSLTLAKATVCQAFQSSELSICNSHSSQWVSLALYDR